MNDETMAALYDGKDATSTGQCGLYKSCSTGQCMNVFSFVSMNEDVYNSQIDTIKNKLSIDAKTNTNVADLFVEMIGVGSSTSSSFYYHYEELLVH